MLIGYWTEGADRVTVTLDGADVTHDCTALSPDEGWVEVLLRDAAGALVLSPDGGGIKQERRYGIVGLSTKAPE